MATLATIMNVARSLGNNVALVPAQGRTGKPHKAA
jgi:hypothetical protein